MGSSSPTDSTVPLPFYFRGSSLRIPLGPGRVSVSMNPSLTPLPSTNIPFDKEKAGSSLSQSHEPTASKELVCQVIVGFPLSFIFLFLTFLSLRGSPSDKANLTNLNKTQIQVNNVASTLVISYDK